MMLNSCRCVTGGGRSGRDARDHRREVRRFTAKDTRKIRPVLCACAHSAVRAETGEMVAGASSLPRGRMWRSLFDRGHDQNWVQVAGFPGVLPSRVRCTTESLVIAPFSPHPDLCSPGYAKAVERLLLCEEPPGADPHAGVVGAGGERPLATRFRHSL